MTIKYEITINELKAILELIQELCHRNGIDEVITEALFRKFNERNLK